MRAGGLVQIDRSAALGPKAEFVAGDGRDGVGMPYEGRPVKALLILKHLQRKRASFLDYLFHHSYLLRCSNAF